MSRTRFFQFSLFIVFLASCESNPLDVDVSNEKLSLEVHRFDQDVLEIRDKEPFDAYQNVFQKHGKFTDDYFEFILQLGSPQDSSTLTLYSQIMKDDSLLIKTQAGIEQVHAGKVEGYTLDIEDAFKHYRYHFPEAPIPDLNFINSWFNYAVIPTDTLLSIGLEFFLGPEHEVVKVLPGESFPQYFRNKMRPELVATDAVRGWLMVQHQDLLKQDKFIHELIWYGKMMYLLDACMPNVEDDVKIGYSANALSWCEDHEEAIWKQIANQEIMFQTNRFENSKWFSDGPFTRAANVPQESPAQLGIWMGWQIVRDYMNENSEVTLPQLLEETNSQRILKHYDPRN